MREMKRRFRYCLGSGVVLASMCIVLTPVFAQNIASEKEERLPNRSPGALTS